MDQLNKYAAAATRRGKTKSWYSRGLAVSLTAVAMATGAVVSFLAAPPLQNLGSPAFANPSEIRYRDTEKVLRGVIQMTSGTYSIPNVGNATLRQFQGWDPANPQPPAKTSISPGPTLRARLGDRVEISFFNKVDESQFPYSFDTTNTPGLSSQGCDQSTSSSPTSGYPTNGTWSDYFPNCFHGSSTANLHFHGTHTDPDGLGDNVLVQVIPQVKQQDWTNAFNTIYKSATIPQTWAALPSSYTTPQLALVKANDVAAAAAAKKNGLPVPNSLYDADMTMIKNGQWPQYLVGAFPNFFEIPDYSSGKWKAGQAPGTHWYHAHKHGSTSLHILNGLAGALIIEANQPGGYDNVIKTYYNWGASYGTHEKVIVFQQYDTTQNLERSQTQAGGGGKGIKQVLVNGLLTPTITMQPGEVQLWRMVNATEGNNAGKLSVSLFQTTGFTVKQTAMDGVQFSPTNYTNQPFLNASAPGGQVPGGLALGGGNRADILIQAPTTPGVSSFVTGGTGGTVLFYVNVTGTAITYPNGPFPTTWATMPPFLNDLPTPGPKDVKNPNSPVKFQFEAGRVAAGGYPPPHFMINGKQFEESGPIIDQCMPLNGLQDWVLENWTSTPHPFHIHINPFQVMKIETPSQATPTSPIVYSTFAPANNRVWQDVITMPPAVISADGKTISPGRVTIRQTYLDFDGTFVLHCHILAHEDRGMMQLVRVVPAALYPSGCQTSVPAHH